MPTSGNRLEGRVALITGASRGIGRASSLALARERANVVAVALPSESDRLRQLRDEIRDQGTECLPVEGDAREADTATRAVALAMDRFGRVDILLNNVGIGLYTSISECSLKDYDEIMDLTESLIRETATQVVGTTQLTWDGAAIDVGPAFRRRTMEDAVLEHNPEIGREELRDRAALTAHAGRLGVPVKHGYGWGKLLLEIFEKTVEHTLVQPTFITAHPVEVSPLARASDTDAEITDRFELFIGGKEIANGFSELNDPEDQAARFRAQADAKDKGDDEAMHFDADYIRALEVGLPPTGGLGVGIDRLVMLLADAPSIRDVLLFPYMRPEG